MAFTEAERVQIRHALGFSAIFLQADPRAENAISSIQSVTDGGTRPDNSTEVYVRSLLADITTIESSLRALWSLAFVQKAEDATLDPYRGMMMLRSEGRRTVTAIARQLALQPRADVFSATAPGSMYPYQLSPGANE